MQGTRTSLRYAKALFETAKTQAVNSDVYKDLELLKSIINEKTEFFNIIHNPTIKRNTKEILFSKIFKNRVQDLTMKFLLLLLNKGREAILSEVIRHYIDLDMADKGVLLAEVISAKPISENIKKDIKNKISANGNVQLTEKIDKSILGGLIINIGDSQYDASVRKKINNVKRAFKL